MKIRKTLHEIYSELNDLRDMKQQSANSIANSIVNANSYNLEKYKEEYKHYDEVIKYLSQIAVQYEDKYETNE